MKHTWLAMVALAVLASTHAQSVLADQYWTYSDANVDVIAAGSARYTANVATRLRKLDAAMGMVMKLDLANSRVPIHVYAVPREQLNKLYGGNYDYSSVFMNGEYESVILVDKNGDSDSTYASAYFGYAGSLILNNAYAAHYPDWARIGFAEIFAATVIDRNKVTVGGFRDYMVQALRSNHLIPTRTLFRARQSDPQFRTADGSMLFSAECWFLVHMLTIEGTYNDSFTKYLQLTADGQGEDAAYSASFPISYEDLDRKLADFLAAGRIKELVVMVPDLPAAAPPQPSTQVELKARLARIGMTHRLQADYAMQLAHEALASDAENEMATRALALGQLKQEQFVDALATSRKLATHAKLTAGGYADNGAVLQGLATAVDEKRASLGVEAPDLRQQARDSYRHAVALDANDLEAWHRLTELVIQQEDEAAAKVFLAEVEPVFYRHSNDARLANAIARLSERAHDYDNAFKFAVAWRTHAIDPAERRSADSMVDNLRDYLQRRNAAQPSGAGADPSAHH